MIVSKNKVLITSRRLNVQATGKDSGSHVADVNLETPRINVHRGRFLGQLLQTIPDTTVKTSRKLSTIRESSDAVILIFEDGSVEHSHGVIACNGINSATRATILGSEHPAVKPAYTGGYNHRMVVPIEMAKAAFGKEYYSQVTQHGWVGDGGFLLTDLVDNQTAMQVVAGWTTEEAWPHESPFVPWPKDKVREDLEGWGEMEKR